MILNFRLLKTLKGKDLTNMIEKVPFENVILLYQGNSQVLTISCIE
jgi:hypothetical protein